MTKVKVNNKSNGTTKTKQCVTSYHDTTHHDRSLSVNENVDSVIFQAVMSGVKLKPRKKQAVRNQTVKKQAVSELSLLDSIVSFFSWPMSFVTS